MPKTQKTSLRKVADAIESADTLKTVESVTESFYPSDSSTKFHDDKFEIENAALFGPPFDTESGHYISNRGTHYAPGFHESLMESASGAMGWDYHPEGPSGAKQMRATSKATHKVKAGTPFIDKTGASPMLRGTVKFVGKDKESNYEIAKEASSQFGFSAFVPRPLGKFDPKSGFDVVHKVDPSEKRNVSFDLVEASGATRDITESAADHSQQENAMDAKEIQKLITDSLEAAFAGRDEKFKETLLKEIEPGLKAGKEALEEAAALKRTQLVQSRLSEKKLASEDTTSALIQQLSICENAEQMDKFIDDHKTFLAKRHNPVLGAGGAKPEKVELGEARGMLAVMEDCGYRTADTPAKRREAGMKFLATDYGLCSMSPATESHPTVGQYSFEHRHDEKLRKFRKEFKESATFHGIFRACFGKELKSMRDVTEANLDLDSSGFLGINAALLAAILIDAYDIAGGNLVVDDIVMPYNSTLVREVIPGYSAPGGLGVQTTEGDLAPIVSMGSKGVLDHNIAKVWARVVISREEYLYDQKGLVIMRANSIAEQIRVQRDLRKMLVITDQSSYTIGTQTAWQWYQPATSGLNTANPTYTTTPIYNAGNTVLTNPLTTYTNVEEAVSLLKAQTDEQGNRLFNNSMRPLHVLIPDTLEFNAWHIFNALGTQLRSNAQANIVEGGNPFAGTVIHMSSTLSTIQATTSGAGGDPIGTWYIAGAGGFQRQFVDKRVIPFEVVQVPQAEVQSVSADVIAGVKVEFKEDVVPRDYKYVIKCKPS